MRHFTGSEERSWETDDFLAGTEIYCLWNLNVHYCVNNSLPHDISKATQIIVYKIYIYINFHLLYSTSCVIKIFLHGIYFNTFGMYSIFPLSECVHCNITKSRGCAAVEGMDGSLVFWTPLVYCHIHIRNSPNIEEHRDIVPSLNINLTLHSVSYGQSHWIKHM